MGSEQAQHVHVAIIGSGFAGLGTAIRLAQEGERDFLVLEKGTDVGGTWRDNSYPGCACDVQSHLYSFSFALNPDWSRSYSPQPEIYAYLRGCAERFGVMERMRFGCEVRDARWDAASQRWTLETSQGLYTADVVIAGVGPLSEPLIPKLKGLETFRGKVFHSARWDHGYDLAGKRVAVVGTGASAIQFVPAIQPKVAKLHLFQRTPPWIVPRRDHAISPWKRALYRSVPATQRAVRDLIYWARELMVFGFRDPRTMKWVQKLALRRLERQVADPALRAKLMPDYTLGCKRVLISDDYLPSLTKPNVEVITSGVAEVRENAVVGTDGTVREVDAIIFGTGFHVTDMAVGDHVWNARGETLNQVWAGSPKAHLGTTVSGFPNFFMLLGPNTGLGHTSVVYMIEAQIEHVLSALRYMREKNVAAVEPKAEAQAQFVAGVDREMKGTVWTSGGCASWYLDATGRNSTLWPGFTFAFKKRVARFDPGEYLSHPRTASERAPAKKPTRRAAGARREAADG